MNQNRNRFVDVMRGIAILLVVLGHTMSGSATGAEETFLYNIVWSLQMPLFILISGYVTRYSREIENGVGLLKYVKRRTIAYLLPWAVWTFFVRGLILGQHNFLNIKWLLWHMDSGYWFLATIWTISMIFGVGTFLARKAAKKHEVKQRVFTLLFYITGMAVLFGIGMAFGMTFFAIKLTLYYMPFYFAGYVYGQYRDAIIGAKWGKTAVEAVVAVSFVAWITILVYFNIYSLPDGNVTTVIRALSSVTGCVAVCGLCKGLYNLSSSSPVSKLLDWCGEQSLKIYLTHYLFLYLIKVPEIPAADSIQGIGMITVNYLFTAALTLFVIRLLNTNRILNFVLFGSKR